MAFYGFIVKSGSSHEAEIPENTVFTLCNVALSANDGQKAQLFVETDGSKYLLATLTAGKVDQQPLDLNFFFDEEAPTKFTVTGNGELHLTGYLQLEDDDVDMDDFDDDDEMGLENAGEEHEVGEDEEDEEEGVPQKVQPKKEAPKNAAPQQPKNNQNKQGGNQGKSQGQNQGKAQGKPQGGNQNNQQKRPNASPNDAQNKKQKTNTPGRKQ